MTLDSDHVSSAIASITDDLVTGLEPLTFSEPITHVYNPLVYAREGYDRYITLFGDSPKTVLLVGMNPGPFGMAQTGVPFGDVEMVSQWMGIEARVSSPTGSHPKRPIMGFSCTRGEVSGRRLWGWARSRWITPQAFFESFFVLNYCPLVFMEAGGRNRTPDKLPVSEKSALFHICDHALRQSIAIYKPQWVIGIGGFAEKRVREALNGSPPSRPKIGRIIHPSPANPKANKGWAAHVESELADMGIRFPR